MTALVTQVLTLLAVSAQPLGPGDYNRSLKMGDVERTFVVHVPPKYDAKKPTPVVLVYHGALPTRPSLSSGPA